MHLRSNDAPSRLLIEAAGMMVLLDDPQIKPASRASVIEAADSLRQQTPADTLAGEPGGHVQIIEIRAPDGVFAGKDASEPCHLATVLSHHNKERLALASGKSCPPGVSALFMDAMVKKIVRECSTISGTPTLGVEAGDGHYIVGRGIPENH
jgi:hypothetical protein